MDSKTITKFLNETLDCKFWDEKYGLNGLQVEAPNEIKKIGFAVDASQELFKKAKDCDLLVVHHGLLWKIQGIAPLTDNNFNRIKTLLDNNCGLYGVHLPLDFHPTLGNNAGIIEALNLEYQKDFAEVGKIALTKTEMTYESFMEAVKSKINPNSKSYKFNKNVSKIGICSGGGQYHLYDAIKEGCDTFITGDQSHQIYHEAKENNINLIFAGHYATEVFGVKSLMKLIQKNFDLECEYYDIPTGL